MARQPFAPLTERLIASRGSVHWWIEYLRRNPSDGPPSLEGLADAAEELETYIADLQRDRSELMEELRELRATLPRHG